MISTYSNDFSLGGALKGEIAGWKSSFSVDYGWNNLKYGVEHTLNPSLGPTSPHSFYAGQMTYDQTVGNADFSRDFEVGLAGPLNVAFGIEARDEQFKIGAGEPGSYQRGTVAPTLSLGSRGFSGFTPENVVDKSRTNVGAYLTVEGKLTSWFTGSAAVRQEHYSDFGDNTSGKVAGRIDVTPNFAFRGSAESGFRAPSLQQEYFTSTSILFINGVPFDTGTFPSISPTGKALGGQPLGPEKSKNYSIGTIFHQCGLEVTIDAYRIDVDNKVVLSETLTGSGRFERFDDLQPAPAVRRLGRQVLHQRRRLQHEGGRLQRQLSHPERRSWGLQPDGLCEHEQPQDHKDPGFRDDNPSRAGVAVRTPGRAPLPGRYASLQGRAAKRLDQRQSRGDPAFDVLW